MHLLGIVSLPKFQVYRSPVVMEQDVFLEASSARPFLKWVGGKGQLINQFQEYYPKDLYSQKIDKYIEPFIGGGAIFFDIMQKQQFFI